MPTITMTGGLENTTDLKKVLANLWSRKRIANKAHDGRGHETK